MKHKLFRILVAVVLVCCLVVSWSPIRAKAVGVDQFIGVAVDKVGLYAQAGALSTGAAVFSWVLLGLGLIVTTAQAIDLMNRYTEFTGELETSIYYYPDGSWSYGVDMGFVERVRAFLFEDGFLVYDSIDLSGLSDYQLSNYDSITSSHDYCYTWIDGGKIFFVYDSHPIDLVYSSSSSKWILRDEFYKQGGTFYFTYYTTSAVHVVQNYSTYSLTVHPVACGALNKTVVATDDFLLGEVAPLEVPMPEAYPEWHTNARPATNPDTQEEITVLPIPLDPNDDTEALPDGVTQPDAWQGTVADPLPDSGTDIEPDTGTDTDGSLSNTPWETFKKWISTGWESIIQAIPTPDSIAEAVGNVIKSIFVPDADFITEKWNDIRSRFEFADSITATGEVLVNILDGLDPEPPVIYIDLGAAEGSYNIGGEVPFIDLRWYAQYKPTMDMIVSAFLWLAFVWRLILKLPGIISGMPGEFVLMNLPVNLPHLGIGSGQRREELESGRNNRRLGDGH